MPVVNVYRSWSSDEVEQSTSGRRFRTQYTVLTDDPVNDTGFVVMAAPGLPQYGDVLVEDISLRARSIYPRRRTLTLWEVDVEFNTASGPSSSNPLDEPPQISWDYNEYQEEVDIDIDGKPMLNSAREPLSAPVDFADPVLTVVRNYASISESTLLAYRNVVNSDFFLVPAGQALMRPIRAVRQVQNGFTFWQLTFNVMLREALPEQPGPFGTVGGSERAWYQRFVNEGRHEYDGDNPNSGVPLWHIITDPHNRPVSSPVLLDFFGQRLPHGQPANFVEYKVRRSLPFQPLGIL